MGSVKGNGTPVLIFGLVGVGAVVALAVAGLSAEALATAIVRLGLPFDQVIWYAPERSGHVHVSLTEKRPNRGQTLHAPAAGGYVAWTPAARVA